MTRSPLTQRLGRWPLLVGCALAGLLLLLGQAADGRQRKRTVLRIGSSGTLGSGSRSKQEAALKTLKSFIKEETGMDNEIIRQKNWRVLADKMAEAKLDLGVFHGDEFAWARQKHSGLEPLVLAVNGDRYPVAYVVTRRASKVKDFAGLRGQSLTMPPGPHFLRVFLRQQAEKSGKKLDEFFPKIKTQEDVEEALDDVVDGVVQAAAVEKVSLEAYKRRKPGRFKQLKEVARSEPFPPAVIAYHGKVLAEAERRRFRDALLGAVRKERGRQMLTLFRLTGFQTVPDDFSKVVARTQKLYPPSPPDPTK